MVDSMTVMDRSYLLLQHYCLELKTKINKKRENVVFVLLVVVVFVDDFDDEA